MDAIAIAGNTKPTKGTKIEGKKDAVIKLNPSMKLTCNLNLIEIIQK
jgi:hypothetical protein